MKCILAPIVLLTLLFPSLAYGQTFDDLIGKGKGLLGKGQGYLCETTGVGCSETVDFNKGYEAYKKGDYANALSEWRPLAKKGHVGAQFNLGLMYFKGQGLPRDYRTAAKWYTLAAEQGFARAQYSLGLMYGKGQGVPQGYKEAFKWFRKAAEQGHAEAQKNLSWMYSTGTGVIQDNVYAHMWANIAASNGNAKGILIRESVSKRMTTIDISKAQKIARECVRKKYKRC